MKAEDEIWRSVPEFEKYYQVSNLGRIRRLLTRYGKKLKQPKILKPTFPGTGYPTVHLCKNGKIKTTSIHRLVARKFLPMAFLNQDWINHKDGNKRNNHFSNLEWCTRKENEEHAFKNGLKAKGTQLNHTKLNRFKVKKIRALHNFGDSFNEIASRFGVHHTTIRRVIKKQIWGHV